MQIRSHLKHSRVLTAPVCLPAAVPKPGATRALVLQMGHSGLAWLGRLDKERFQDEAALAAAIKALPLRLLAPRPLPAAPLGTWVLTVQQGGQHLGPRSSGRASLLSGAPVTVPDLEAYFCTQNSHDPCQ